MDHAPSIPARESSLQQPSSIQSEKAGPSLSGAVGRRSDETRYDRAKSSLEASFDERHLEGERRRLVDEIAQHSHELGPQPSLDDAGRATFERAGFKDRIGKRSDIEVKTQWLSPVIQEHVRPVVHTLIRTEVTRDVHQHHIYPKIQPISDPDPIVLPTRHRFFSSVDGQWHEVIGDEAAIAILGEDVFLNGPKVIRMDRRPAVESGLSSGGNALESRVIEREWEGDNQSDWKVVQGAATTDAAIVKAGKLHDGLDSVTEGVRTMHMVL